MGSGAERNEALSAAAGEQAGERPPARGPGALPSPGQGKQGFVLISQSLRRSISVRGLVARTEGVGLCDTLFCCVAFRGLGDGAQRVGFQQLIS